MNYSDELNQLSDEELENIYIKGENINISTSRASAAKRILDSRRNKSYVVNFPTFKVPTFKGIGSANASLSALSNINQSIDKIANAYAQAGSSVNTLAKSLASVQKTAGTQVWQEIAKNTAGSQILDSVKDIQRLNIETLNKTSSQNFLPTKLAEDITSVNKQKKDIIFNFPAYKYIFNLEFYLRIFITKHIIEPNKKQIASKIPDDMLNKWKDKKKDEEKNIHVNNANYDLIEYSDFTDLKIILEKRTTIALIKDKISETNLKTITSKLTELEPIRLKIAHSRALTKDEFNTLKMYSDKIKKVLS